MQSDTKRNTKIEKGWKSNTIYKMYMYIFICPVAMYRYESWTIKTEHQRIDAFELWYGEDSWKSLGLQGDPTSQS